MIKKILKIAGMATPFVMHFIIMSVILILVLVNIKYGLEFDLIGTEYGHLVNGVYNIVYFTYLLIVRWIENKNKIKPSSMDGNR